MFFDFYTFLSPCSILACVFPFHIYLIGVLGVILDRGSEKAVPQPKRARVQSQSLASAFGFGIHGANVFGHTSHESAASCSHEQEHSVEQFTSRPDAPESLEDGGLFDDILDFVSPENVTILQELQREFDAVEYPNGRPEVSQEEAPELGEDGLGHNSDFSGTDSDVEQETVIADIDNESEFAEPVQRVQSNAYKGASFSVASNVDGTILGSVYDPTKEGKSFKATCLAHGPSCTVWLGAKKDPEKAKRALTGWISQSRHVTRNGHEAQGVSLRAEHGVNVRKHAM